MVDILVELGKILLGPLLTVLILLIFAWRFPQLGNLLTAISRQGGRVKYKRGDTDIEITVLPPESLDRPLPTVGEGEEHEIEKRSVDLLSSSQSPRRLPDR